MYKVTGILRSGKRFKAMYYSNRIQALSINLWSGSVWEKQESGKWKRIKQV